MIQVHRGFCWLPASKHPDTFAIFSFIIGRQEPAVPCWSRRDPGRCISEAIAVWLMVEAGNLGSWSEDKVGGVSLRKAGVGRCSKASSTHPAFNESFLVLSYSRVLERSVLVAPCFPSSPRCAFLGYFYFSEASPDSNFNLWIIFRAHLITCKTIFIEVS